MKNFAILSLLSFALLGCNNDDDTQFNLTYSEDFTLPATYGIEYPVSTDLIIFETNASSRFNDNETKASLVNEARISSLRISLGTPSGADFGTIDQMNLYIQATNLSEVKIGSIDNPTSGETIIQGDMKVLDVKEYLKQSEFSIRVEFSSDGFNNEDLFCSMNLQFTVDATKA